MASTRQIVVGVERAKAAGTPMRIGVNSGSLPKHVHALERERRRRRDVLSLLDKEVSPVARRVHPRMIETAPTTTKGL